jgi:hypothetical protein
MQRRLWLLLPLVLVVPACSSDDSPAIEGAGQQTTSSSTTTSSTAPTPTSSSSTAPASSSDGAALVGPAGTSGTLRYTLQSDRSLFCYRITIAGAGAATAAHVHRQNGDEVVTLTAPGPDGKVDTCSASDSVTLEEIQAQPKQFYVDVHTAKGVLKGTL